MSARPASCSCDASGRWRMRLLAAAAGIAAAGCGVADDEATTIEMHDGNRYSPSAVRIRAGETVVWSNASSEIHTVSTADGAAPSVGGPDGAEPFNSGPIPAGETYSRRFDEPGVYVFACEIHGDDGMVGIVSVGR